MKSIPIYQSIKSYLYELIEKNKHSEKYMLPSESQLCLKFGASRAPVRKALEDLEEEGLIIKRQGKGVFINRSASNRANAMQTDNVVALILPDISTTFLQKITLGVRHYCDMTKNKYIVLPSFSLSQSEQSNIKLAKELHCNGILLMPIDEDVYNDALLSLIVDKTPCIFIDRQLFGLNIPSVSSDHMQMGYNATELLLKKGADKIAYFAQTDVITSISERVQGYVKALNEHNVRQQYVVNLTGIKGETLKEKLEFFLRKKPEINGVIINSGIPAASAIHAMSKLGREINKDYFMSVFDENNELVDLCLDYESDAIIQDGYTIGYTACKLLLDQIINGTVPPPKSTVPLISPQKPTR